MILQGDVLEQLRPMRANSVHMVVTSPPYWSLRDYGVPPSIWGGDPACEHVWQSAGSKEGYTAKKKWQHSMTNEPDSNGRGEPRAGKKRSRLRSDNPEGWNQIEQGQFCTSCGAWRGCLGLEPTPDLYVEHIATIFDEVRRVLRHDGCLFLNMGDSYMTDAPGRNSIDPKNIIGRKRGGDERPNRGRLPGLKHKDLVGVPWMVAFALRARGWYLRSDIIWSKTNPMPESIKDRPTKSHEYIFLLAKSQRYYFDPEAIREKALVGNHHRNVVVSVKSHVPGAPVHTGLRSTPPASAGRNRRSVWTFPTSPYKGAHFATFPPRLVEPCILAGTSSHGCCSMCGAPYKRIVKLGEPLIDQMKVAGADNAGKYSGKATKAYAGTGAQDPSATKARILDGMRERITVGWRRTCAHTLSTVEPCVVLDPFGGTGTTGMVAEKHGRDYILIELSAANVALTNERLAPSRVEVSA